MKPSGYLQSHAKHSFCCTNSKTIDRKQGQRHCLGVMFIIFWDWCSGDRENKVKGSWVELRG